MSSLQVWWYRGKLHPQETLHDLQVGLQVTASLLPNHVLNCLSVILVRKHVNPVNFRIPWDLWDVFPAWVSLASLPSPKRNISVQRKLLHNKYKWNPNYFRCLDKTANFRINMNLKTFLLILNFAHFWTILKLS